MNADRFLIWAFYASPLIVAAIVIMLKPGIAVSTSNGVGDWINEQHTKAKEKTGFFADYVLRPVLACFRILLDQTAKIDDQFQKAGVQLASLLYLTGAILFLAYWVTAIVLAIALIAAVLWIISQFSEQNNSTPTSGSSERSSTSDWHMMGGPGESRQREGFVEPYVEERDAYGNLVGESRQRQGFLEPYVEHRDAYGKLVGESRQRDGFLEPYVEHRDADGNLIGESRQRQGFLEPYVEHRDAEGNLVGESRERDGFLGPYTEHKKSE